MSENDAQHDEGFLRPGEYHPAADLAQAYISTLSQQQLAKYFEAFASTALSGNRSAAICLATLNRLMNNESVSDRYLLGLAWMIKDLVEKEPRIIL